MSRSSGLSRIAALALAAAISPPLGGCGGGAGASSADGAADASGERAALRCAPIDGGPDETGDAASAPGTDEFGPNAPASKTASSLGRVNVYEVTSPSLLERVDVFLRADLDHTRLTLAVQEAPSRTTAFRKLAEIQIDVGTCEGWTTSGPLAVPLIAGRFYAVGFDPNQAVTPWVSTDADSLPIDGVFGRLVGSKTATSVSVPTITWDKFSDKEYNRQRLRTSPREPDPVPPPPPAAGADGATDGGADGRG